MTSKSSAQQNRSYRTFDEPDQQGKFNNGTIDLVAIEDQQIGRITFESGWRLSDSDQTLRSPHVGIITRGSMHIQDDNGQDYEVGEGSVVAIRNGYDAWTDGPCEFLDLTAPSEFLTTSSH